ncbi:hypothetical protein LA080_015261 [Diaporthe eres]|nr:hypothetical protein LA080_015261 [Diaporthe eres]
MSEEAVNATSQSNSQRLECLKNLSVYLFFRYQRFMKIDDLDKAIDKAEKIISATPAEDCDRPSRLMNLAVYLGRRYEVNSHPEDLDKALASIEEARNKIPDGDARRADILTNSGLLLKDRFQATGYINDLDEAILRCQQAASATTSTHSSRADILANLATCLSEKYQCVGDMEYLTEAIKTAEEAVSATPRESLMDGIENINTLAAVLSYRYERTGELADLRASISKAREVVAATVEDHPKLPDRLNNLGSKLHQWYGITGDIGELEQAIDCAQRAAAVRVKLDLPESPGLLNNLSVFLSENYKRTGNLDDLDTAISLTKRATHIELKRPQDRAVWLNTLGSLLADRYYRTGNESELSAAVLRLQEALDATPQNHPNYAGWLNNLSLYALSRYQLSSRETDLELAVSSAERAVKSTPEDHPDRSGWLKNLGNAYSYFSDRHEHTGSLEFLDKALDYFLEASQCKASPPLQRISGCGLAISILHRKQKFLRAASVAKEALALLPHVCSRRLSRNDQQFAAVQTSGLAADACSIFIRAGMVVEALQAIEFGRCLILGYLIDGRDALSQLRHHYHSRAELYEKLRFQAFRHIDMQKSAVRDRLLEERQDAVERLADCEKEIRRLRGFERFLLPPPLDELVECAEEGPIIVVNVTDIGSDAIIVSAQRLSTIPLSNLISESVSTLRANVTKYGKARECCLRDMECEKPQYGSDFLSWLWTTCVRPILDHLKLPERREPSGLCDLPRVWWIGTGAAGSLPFHSAGQYDSVQIDRECLESCLDRVISSYTPSIKALSYSRERASGFGEVDFNDLSALLVGMPTTPGLRRLNGVMMENEAIREVIGHGLNVRELTGPTANEVLAALSSANIVHFACHGVSHAGNPSESHLFLQKNSEEGLTVDQLTVSALLDASLQGGAWTAYLSACSTAEVKAESLADENIHIASAFQVAGFAHVIGSLWSADDDICVRVAKLFYQSLMASAGAADQNRAVAEALQYALRELRKDHLDNPELWALYTHSGA